MKKNLITEFGASVCDRLQTPEIQMAIDTCFREGGGTVVVPAGIYRTGSLWLRSGVTLYLESGAILEGSRWNRALIRAIHAENIAVIGEKGSYINGANCYDSQGEEGYRGPHVISFWYCQKLRLEGYSIVDGGNWSHAVFRSKDISFRNITVYGGHDGLDIMGCDNVMIEDCRFQTGDDCVAGYDNCDVVIRNCLFDSSCSAMRFGGNNILVENCRSVAPASFGHRELLSQEEKARGNVSGSGCRHNMLNFFLYYCDFREKVRKTPGNILIRNCVMENPDRIFALNFDGQHKWCANRSLSSITFQNCQVSGVKQPAYIYGDAEEPIDFAMENVQITAREGYEEIPLLQAINYNSISLQQVTAEGIADPALVIASEGEIRTDSIFGIRRLAEPDEWYCTEEQ